MVTVLEVDMMNVIWREGCVKERIALETVASYIVVLYYSDAVYLIHVYKVYTWKMACDSIMLRRKSPTLASLGYETL